MDRLTDDQCNEFRRLPGSFNDMVRKIYEAGRMTGAQECCELSQQHGCGMLEIIENHFDFKAE